MRGSAPDKIGVAESDQGEIDWELRPGGMLVQKREDGDEGFGPMIKIKVAHGNSQHEVSVPAQSTFGELKRVLMQKTNLEPQEQRLLFRGKEKDNEEFLHMVGVKDKSKIVLLEGTASKERKVEEMKWKVEEMKKKFEEMKRKVEEMETNKGMSKVCEAVVIVRSEVDKLAEKVTDLELAVNGGVKIAEKEFLVLTELLMVQLLKLDGIEAEGEAKVQRRSETISCLWKQLKALLNPWVKSKRKRAEMQLLQLVCSTN